MLAKSFMTINMELRDRCNEGGHLYKGHTQHRQCVKLITVWTVFNTQTQVMHGLPIFLLNLCF